MLLMPIVGYLLIAFIFTLILIHIIDHWEYILIWIPAFIVYVIIATTCIINVPLPTSTETYYGYDETHIYPPGYEGFKFPWHHIDMHKFYRDDNYNIYIPTETRDGMRIYYVFAFLHCKMDPIKFQTMFHHNISNFESPWIDKIKPTVDRIMATKSEADVELNGGNTVDEIYEANLPLTDSHHTYLTHTSDIEHQAYFHHIDDPQFNYACSGVGAGYCAMGDEFGLPSASNRYKGQPIPYKDRTTPQPTLTHEPTPIYIDDSNAFSSQEEVNEFIDDFLNEHPELA